MALITCQNVSFVYEGNTAVSGLDFKVNNRDYLCVIGENGSGKSTLIKGLLKLKTPATGSILMGDGLKPSEIGYLPQQNTMQKNFPASVYEVVLSGRLASRGVLPFYSRTDKAIVEDNMKRFRIKELCHRCYGELSGGQQQRVLLARALSATKKLLLLDEPVAGLDPIATKELYSMIDSINKEMGITIIMVSHDIQNAVNYASHILHLQNKQVFFGTKHDYMDIDLGKTYTGGTL